jgi:hypothetical protein
MKKQKLSAEDLTVESFDTGEVLPESGTVHGQAATFVASCPATCFPKITCDGGDTCISPCTGECF